MRVNLITQASGPDEQIGRQTVQTAAGPKGDPVPGLLIAIAITSLVAIIILTAYVLRKAFL